MSQIGWKWDQKRPKNIFFKFLSNYLFLRIFGDFFRFFWPFLIFGALGPTFNPSLGPKNQNWAKQKKTPPGIILKMAWIQKYKPQVAKRTQNCTPKFRGKTPKNTQKRGLGQKGVGYEKNFLPYSHPRDCRKYHAEYRDQIIKTLVRNPGHPNKQRKKETNKQTILGV